MDCSLVKSYNLAFILQFPKMGLFRFKSGEQQLDYNSKCLYNNIVLSVSFGPGQTSFVLKVLLQVKHTEMKLHDTDCVMKLVLTKYSPWLLQAAPCQRLCGVPAVLTLSSTTAGTFMCTNGWNGCNYFQCEPTTCVPTVYE